MKKLAIIYFFGFHLLFSQQLLPKVGVSIGIYRPNYYNKNTKKSKSFLINSNWGTETLLHLNYEKFGFSIGYAAQTHTFGSIIPIDLQKKDKGTFQNYLFSIQQMPVLLNVRVFKKNNNSIRFNVGYVKTVAVLEKVIVDNTNSNYKVFKYYNLSPWRWKGYATRFGIEAAKQIHKNWQILVTLNLQLQQKKDYDLQNSYNPVNDYNWPIVHYPNTQNPDFVSAGIGILYNFNQLKKAKIKNI